MSLSERDVVKIYNKIKKDINKAICRNKYEQAAHLIESAARWGYTFNFLYCDDELEDSLQKIANTLKLTAHFRSCNERIAFICNKISGELVYQYIHALNASSFPYLVIAVRHKGCQYQEILEKIESNSKAQVVLLEESGTYLSNSQKIVELIEAYQPSKILSHVWPWDIVPLLALSALHDITRYNINFNDHSFWLGKTSLDYNIEFRPYGATISIEKRKLQPRQIFYLPYYPIIVSQHSFQGFPFNHKDKVLIFSGGSAYKMLGNNNSFFELIDRVLEENENAIIYIASGQMQDLKKEIQQLKHKNRIYLSSYRNDISEIFKRCDIYLSSSPIGGGLMTQLAAVFKKPILAYTISDKVALDEVNGLVSYYKQINITQSSLDDLCQYAHKLCSNKDFRKTEGEKLGHSVITIEDFNLRFSQIIKNEILPNNLPHIDIDYERIKSIYLGLENSKGTPTLSLLLLTYRLKTFFKFPPYIATFLGLIYKKCMKYIKNRF